MMDADVVAHHMDECDARRNLSVEVFQKRNEFFLPLAVVTLSVDLAATRVEGSKQVQRTIAFVFMFNAVGHASWLSRLGGMQTGSGLKRRLFINGEHDFMCAQGSRIELDELCNTGIEGVVTWLFRVEPHVIAPGLEFMGGQNTPDGLGRNGLNDTLFNQGTGQLGTVPLGQRAAEVLRPLARHLHQMDGNVGWKKKVSAHGRPYHINRRCRACESVQPTCR